MLVFRPGVLARACEEAPRGEPARSPRGPIPPLPPPFTAPYRHAPHHFSRSICPLGSRPAAREIGGRIKREMGINRGRYICRKGGEERMIFQSFQDFALERWCNIYLCVIFLKKYRD